MKRIVYADPLALEVFLSLLALVVGALWLLPGETFAVSPAYAVARQIAPEVVWGALLIVIGALGLRVAFYPPARLRRQVPMLMAFVWMVLGLSFALVSPLTSGGWVFIMCALGSGWLAWRVW